MVATSLALIAGIQVIRNASPVGWFKGHSAEALSQLPFTDRDGIILIEKNIMTYDIQKTLIKADPSVSYWLKEAIEALDKRDPVDAYNDAQALSRLQEMRDPAEDDPILAKLLAPSRENRKEVEK